MNAWALAAASWPARPATLFLLWGLRHLRDCGVTDFASVCMPFHALAYMYCFLPFFLACVWSGGVLLQRRTFV